MRLTKYGHSCLLVEEGPARLLLDIPVVPNVGYLVGGRLFHRGDAFTPPGRPVEVLAVPAGAPWLKVSEPIDYLHQVRPKVAVPVHELEL
jgi:hypothetical protein